MLCVTFIPRALQKPSQDDDAARAHDLKRRARDIARDSHRLCDRCFYRKCAASDGFRLHGRCIDALDDGTIGSDEDNW